MGRRVSKALSLKGPSYGSPWPSSRDTHFPVPRSYLGKWLADSRPCRFQQSKSSSRYISTIRSNLADISKFDMSDSRQLSIQSPSISIRKPSANFVLHPRDTRLVLAARFTKSSKSIFRNVVLRTKRPLAKTPLEGGITCRSKKGLA